MKTIFFDLDGTLLPIDNEEFNKYYFRALCEFLKPFGYESNAVIDAVWKGTAAMVSNNGVVSNETVFWKTFSDIFGEKVFEQKPRLESFYANEFNIVKACAKANPLAEKLVFELKKRGYKLVLASNPLFPRVAYETRLSWANLSLNDFDYFTTYENSGFCKPNPNYYVEILKQINETAQNCVMVGNDVNEDGIAQSLGFDFYLVTDFLLNTKKLPVEKFKQGSFAAVYKLLLSL